MSPETTRAFNLLEAPKKHYGTLRNFVDGEWVEPETDRFLEVEDPASGESIATVPCSTKTDVDKAIAAAQDAFWDWRSTPPVTRARYLFKIKELLEQNFEELARITTQEHGKAIDEARGETRRSIETVEVATGVTSLMMGYNLEDGAAKNIDEMVVKPAARRGGLHHAVQLPLHDDLLLVAVRDRRRQHLRRQAVGADADHHHPLLRGPPGRRPPGWRHEPRARRPEGLRGHPGLADRQGGGLHRLLAGRQADLQALRRDRQARLRQRRGQELHHGHAGRRDRPLDQQHDGELLRLQRPALPGGGGPAGRRRRLRRAQGEVRRRRQGPRRGPRPGRECRRGAGDLAPAAWIASTATSRPASRRAPTLSSTAATRACPASRRATTSLRPCSTTARRT